MFAVLPGQNITVTGLDQLASYSEVFAALRTWALHLARIAGVAKFGQARMPFPKLQWIEVDDAPNSAHTIPSRTLSLGLILLAEGYLEVVSHPLSPLLHALHFERGMQGGEFALARSP